MTVSQEGRAGLQMREAEIEARVSPRLTLSIGNCTCTSVHAFSQEWVGRAVRLGKGALHDLCHPGHDLTAWRCS